jgi:hypothetical protein
MDNQVNEWQVILAGSSLKEAKIILCLQYFLLILYSRGFIFIFLAIPIMGTCCYYFALEGISSHIFLGGAIIHCLVYLLLNSFVLKNHEIEIAELKLGIEVIKEYIFSMKKRAIASVKNE